MFERVRERERARELEGREADFVRRINAWNIGRALGFSLVEKGPVWI